MSDPVCIFKPNCVDCGSHDDRAKNPFSHLLNYRFGKLSLESDRCECVGCDNTAHPFTHEMQQRYFLLKNTDGPVEKIMCLDHFFGTYLQSLGLCRTCAISQLSHYLRDVLVAQIRD